MSIAALRNKVTIQNRTITPNDFGESDEAWVNFAEVWAEVKPVKSIEYFASAKENGSVTHRVIIRHLDGVKSKMRVLHKGRVLEIKGPPRNYMERDIYDELMCEEVEVG